MIVGLLLLLAIPTGAVPSVSWADPASVLVIVQDNTGPEPGTGTKNPSQYVADYYMQRRGIPASNLLHVSTPIVLRGSGPICQPGGDCDVAHSDSTQVSYSIYVSQIRDPVMAFLSANGGAMRTKIRYIVPVYGVPVTIGGAPGTFSGYPVRPPPFSCGSVDCSQDVSLDVALAAILLPPDGTGFYPASPFFNDDPTSTPPHIDEDTSGVLLVSRLDGRTAAASAALVDNAIAGETAGVNGIWYFDWQGLDGASVGGLDTSTSTAYTLCLAAVPNPATNCVLHNQSGGAGMIQSAPNAAGAWGGYDPSAANAAGYTFVPGAVGAQWSSYTANCIRRPCTGAYVDLWLNQGITATWGAAFEPGASRGTYAMADNVFAHLWRGYTFGEAAYLATQTLEGGQMVFVGDPLYRPSYAQSAAAP